VPAPGKAHLHIGLLKSGTSFIQSQLRHHHPGLAEDGILIPGGRHWERQVSATRDLVARPGPVPANEPTTHTWDWLAQGARDWSGPGVIVSMEFLSFARPKAILRALASLAPREVEIVVTARDLGRVLPAQWQETVQNHRTWTWPEYLASLREQPGSDPRAARSFWFIHDLPRILGRWLDAGDAPVTVVTVPPRGAAPDLLWRRFCSAVQIDADRFPPTAERGANTSLGVNGAELTRRVTALANERLTPQAYRREIKTFLSKSVLAQLDDARFGLPVEAYHWAQDRSQDIIEQVRRLGVRVVGDLDELWPTPPGGVEREPDRFDTDGMLDAAVEALVAFAGHADELRST
jgi:hypothetical protein